MYGNGKSPSEQSEVQNVTQLARGRARLARTRSGGGLFEAARTSGVGRRVLGDPKDAQLKRGANEEVDVGSRTRRDPGARGQGDHAGDGDGEALRRRGMDD